MDLPVTFINHLSELRAASQEIRNSRLIAIDTEANSRHRYPEQLCLIQLATTQNIFVIDTISIKEISHLKDIFLDPSIIKVFHTADYDVRSIDRHYGFRIKGIFDVAVAGRFTGIRQFGLAALIENLIGITIEKNRRMQTADWGKRPLSNEALDYAADDVRYLPALREILVARLQGLERISWVLEECTRLEELRYEAKDPETAFVSVKGASKLDGYELAILKTLYMFREKEALRQNRPPHYVMPESTLVYLAENPDADLKKTPGLGQTGLKRFGDSLKKTLERALNLHPIYRGTIEEINDAERENIQILHEEQGQCLKRLKTWRTSMSTLLSLDTSLIWPTTSLRRLAIKPDTLDAELTSGDVRMWQRDHFASSLSVILKSLQS